MENNKQDVSTLTIQKGLLAYRDNNIKPTNGDSLVNLTESQIRFFQKLILFYKNRIFLFEKKYFILINN